MSEMTVDEALAHADRAVVVRSKRPSMGRFNGDVAITLAAELRRLRSAVEVVRALPTYDLEGPSWDGRLLIRDDVIAALEASDGD